MDSFSRQHPGVAQTTFAIVLSRLPAVNDRPGLVSFLIDSGGGVKSRPGTLTDVALRGRLAHFDAHPANEIAAVRKALSADNGSAVVYESWPAFDSCLRFWYGFVGSQIRPIESTCEACGALTRGSVGGAVGESFLRLCRCGQVSQITVPSHLPMPGATAR